MITNTALVIRPIVAIAFLIGGLLLMRASASRTGAALVSLGALIFLGSELYGVYTLKPFVGRDYDEHWYAQVAAVEALDTIGLAVCAIGVIVYAWRAPSGRRHDDRGR
jgi:hypothetical protein